jgi:hypothetical protein
MSAAEAKATAQIVDEAPSRRKQVWEWLLRYTWYVHPSAHLRLTIEPPHSYRILETSAKPSAKRLELRNLFIQGRRYFLQPTSKQSFRMMTTHKIRWRMRRRTRATAILIGEFTTIDKQTFRLTLSSRIRIWYLLDVFLWPTFITSIIVSMWWSVWLIASLVIALYTLSWLAHRFNAALEAHEMIFFIESILEDYFPETPPKLMASKADVVYEEAFAAAWEQYVEKISD